MRRVPWLLPLAALAAGVCFLAVVRAGDDDEKEKMAAAKKAAADVSDLADSVGKPDELKKKVAAIVKKYDELEPIMWQMKPVEKGGLQVGPPGFYPNDSIELGLLKLGKKKESPDAKTITKNAAEYQRLAQVTRAIAEVAPNYAGKYAKDAAGMKSWTALSQDMAKASDDLIAAVQKDDDKAFYKAVNDLNHSCNECHTQFRDN